MNILAIDPGTTESAYVTWDGKRVHSYGITLNDTLRDMMNDSLYGYAGNIVAIEMVACYGMAVGKEVFETCVWIGRFYEVSPVQPRLVYRKDVKLHHCQSPRAKDANVRQALIDKYGAPGTKKHHGITYGLKSHLWQAFAIATYISETDGQTNDG